MSEPQSRLNEGLVKLTNMIKSSAADEISHLQSQYVLLDESLLQTREEGIISPLPTAAPATSGEYARSRIKTIRNRLFNLGYLGVDNRSSELEGEIRKGIRAFQSEAGLKQDAWVGEKSWAALQELVSFEESANVLRWFNNGKANSALVRATHLRLFALGLMPSKPRGMNRPAIRAGLSRFIAAIDCLEFEVDYFSADLCPETLALLFDQDDLIRRLALSDSLPARQHDGLQYANALIVNIAKIELWLLGYDVDPTGAKFEDTRDSANKRIELKIRSPLYKAMKKYWQDRGEPSRAVMYSRTYLSLSFRLFFSALQYDTMLDQAGEQPDSDELYRELSKDQASMQKIWDNVKAFGARLWDGAKRIWGWFKRVVKSAAKAVGKFIKGVSRVVYHYVLKSYEAMKAVVKGMVNSISFFTKKRLNIPGRNQTMVFHDLDFDFISIVHQSDAPEDVRAIANALKRKSTIFNISCQIFAALLDVLKGILKGALTGWAALLLSLLKLYKRVSHWAPVLIEAQRQDERLSAAI